MYDIVSFYVALRPEVKPREQYTEPALACAYSAVAKIRPDYTRRFMRVHCASILSMYLYIISLRNIYNTRGGGSVGLGNTGG